MGCQGEEDQGQTEGRGWACGASWAFTGAQVRELEKLMAPDLLPACRDPRRPSMESRGQDCAQAPQSGLVLVPLPGGRLLPPAHMPHMQCTCLCLTPGGPSAQSLFTSTGDTTLACPAQLLGHLPPREFRPQRHFLPLFPGTRLPIGWLPGLQELPQPTMLGTVPEPSLLPTARDPLSLR